MYSNTARVLLIAALLVAGSVACSSEPTAEPAPSATTASAVDGEPTRAQAGTKYLEIVGPFNTELDKCVPVLTPLLESGESTSSDFPKVRKVCSGVAGANRKFAEDLTKSAWPSEAQESVNQLVDKLRADQLAWQEVAEVRSHSDLFDPDHPLSEDGPEADMVRAHLGLPAAEEIVEE